jgi:hypothetical protein
MPFTKWEMIIFVTKVRTMTGKSSTKRNEKCLVPIDAGKGPKKPCQNLGPDLVQLSTGKNTPHLYIFHWKLKFCLERVTELPDFKVSILVFECSYQGFLSRFQFRLDRCEVPTLSVLYYTLVRRFGGRFCAKKQC